jgi:hypothetical protein
MLEFEAFVADLSIFAFAIENKGKDVCSFAQR